MPLPMPGMEYEVIIAFERDNGATYDPGDTIKLIKPTEDLDINGCLSNICNWVVECKYFDEDDPESIWHEVWTKISKAHLREKEVIKNIKLGGVSYTEELNIVSVLEVPLQEACFTDFFAPISEKQLQEALDDHYEEQEFQEALDDYYEGLEFQEALDDYYEEQEALGVFVDDYEDPYAGDHGYYKNSSPTETIEINRICSKLEDIYLKVIDDTTASLETSKIFMSMIDDLYSNLIQNGDALSKKNAYSFIHSFHSSWITAKVKQNSDSLKIKQKEDSEKLKKKWESSMGYTPFKWKGGKW